MASARYAESPSNGNWLHGDNSVYLIGLTEHLGLDRDLWVAGYNSAVKRKFLAELKQLVASGLPEIQSERPNPLWQKIRTAVPTLAQTQSRFEEALKTIPCPYDSRQPQRTHDVLVKRNLLEPLLAPRVLRQLFIEQRAFALLQGLVDLRKAPKQAYGLPFHEEMAKLMMRHMRQIRATLSKAGVTEEWAMQALDGDLAQLRKDLHLLYPYYPDTGFPPSSIGQQIVGELIIDVHKIFAAVLSRHRARGAVVLAAHLTAIFCTRPEQLRAGELNPSPEAIRKLLGRRSKGKKVRTIPTL